MNRQAYDIQVIAAEDITGLSVGDLLLTTDNATLTAEQVSTADDDGAFEFVYPDGDTDEEHDAVTVWKCGDDYDTLYVHTEAEARQWMRDRAAEFDATE